MFFIIKQHFFVKIAFLGHFLKKIPTDFFQTLQIDTPTLWKAFGYSGDAEGFFPGYVSYGGE